MSAPGGVADSNSAAAALSSSLAEELMIVTTILHDFLEQNASTAPQVVASSCKILKTLLQNALKQTTDPKKQEMYRRVRLSNAKIQQHIVQVPGALDLLSVAGFREQHQQSTTQQQERVLVYDDAAGPDEQDKRRKQQEIVDAICHGLQAKLQELEPELLGSASSLKTPKAAAAASTSEDAAPSPFLSEEERLARQKKAREARKARETERAATKRRWEENKQDRAELAQRREAQMAAAAEKDAREQGLASGITIRRKMTTTQEASSLPLAKPMEPAAAAGDDGGDAIVGNNSSEAQRKAAIAAARAKHLEAKKRLEEKKGAKAVAAAASASQPVEMQVKQKVVTPKAPPVASLPPQDVDESGSPMDMDAKKPAAASGKSSQTEPAMDSQTPAARKEPPADDFVVKDDDDEKNAFWQKCMEHLPRCAPAAGIRETSYFNRAGMDASGSPKCLKTLYKELDSLKDALPADPNSSIWLRFDEETPQYIRAMIAGSLPGPTPYSGALFVFDIYVPNDYPHVPPKVTLLTTGGGRVRFGPNLYADGKVCLSLLGTWPGPKWNPKHSTVQQVLISIQGLILGVEHPFYLEPGHGGWEGRVKEGDFQSTAHTLSGDVVTQEVGVPQEVVKFEDKIRVGSAKYAMLDILKNAVVATAADTEAASSPAALPSRTTGRRYLQPFALPIQAHFYQNKSQVIKEVSIWLDDAVLGRNREVAGQSLPIDELNGILPKLKALLSELQPPELEKEEKPLEMDIVNSEKVAAEKNDDSPQEDVAMETGAAKEAEPEKDDDPLAMLKPNRQQMQDAAQKGDYVLAGQLQQDIKRIEDLYQEMTKAAKQGDFIRAGRLQAQFKALTAQEEEGPPAAGPSANQNGMAGDTAAAWEEDNEFGDDDEDEMMDDGPPFPPAGVGMNAMMAGAMSATMGGGGHGLGSNVYAPPGYKAQFMNKHHSWGSGNQLGGAEGATGGASASDAEESDQKMAAAATGEDAKLPPKKSIPPHQVCRLRIRLPSNQSIVEDFDKHDALSVVYRHVEPLVQEEVGGGGGKKGPSVKNLVYGPGGAFAQPLSSAGFTLLLTRPKREFSLEMHGTKTLEDLNLSPSATLTVMRCKDRGIALRGELESRLRESHGNAIDVEGLTYEALVELTERLGSAAPADGNAFVSITQEELEQNSTTFSPATHLASFENSMDDGDDTKNDLKRCPICLGEYDATVEEPTLRQLMHCEHIFHTACVETWLASKSSCPLCKTSIVP